MSALSEEKITLENFSSDNRDRHIGNSLYRICNTNAKTGKGKWYIHEGFNDGTEWCRANYFCNDDLQTVIDKINSFTKEKEVISARENG